MSKNKYIEIIRGILVWMIMLFHYTYRFSTIYGISTINFFSLSDWGTIGVGCFFIITGYFLIPKNLKQYDTKKFIMKKILRIYPSYVLCMTITFISIQIWGLAERETNFFDYLLNLTMINGIIGEKYVDGAHWYLTYLVIYYFIIGISLKYSKNIKKTLIIWIIVKDILKLGTIFINTINPIYVLAGGNYVEYIIIGIILREIIKEYKEKKDLEKLIKKNYLYVVLIIISLLQIGIFNNIVVAVGIIIFIMIFLIAIGKKNKKMTKYNPLYFFGSISYIIYLIHQNIGYQMLLAIYNYKKTISILNIFEVSIIVILIAYTINQLFERNVQKWIDIKLNKSTDNAKEKFL